MFSKIKCCLITVLLMIWSYAYERNMRGIWKGLASFQLLKVGFRLHGLTANGIKLTKPDYFMLNRGKSNSECSVDAGWTIDGRQSNWGQKLTSRIRDSPLLEDRFPVLWHWALSLRSKMHMNKRTSLSSVQTSESMTEWWVGNLYANWIKINESAISHCSRGYPLSCRRKATK
jgi:hypothetical protein